MQRRIECVHFLAAPQRAGRASTGARGSAACAQGGAATIHRGARPPCQDTPTPARQRSEIARRSKARRGSGARSRARAATPSAGRPLVAHRRQATATSIPGRAAPAADVQCCSSLRTGLHRRPRWLGGPCYGEGGRGAPRRWPLSCCGAGGVLAAVAMAGLAGGRSSRCLRWPSVCLPSPLGQDSPRGAPGWPHQQAAAWCRWHAARWVAVALAAGHWDGREMHGRQLRASAGKPLRDAWDQGGPPQTAPALGQSRCAAQPAACGPGRHLGAFLSPFICRLLSRRLPPRPPRPPSTPAG